MEIECKYKVVNWNPLGRFYTCRITSASITEPNQEIKAFIGQHITGKTDHDVEAISFKNSEVHYMPRGIGKILPNLRSVKIFNCGLRKITREDLIGLENIESLHIDRNELKSLPDDFFQGMKKLKWISFYDNKLEFVSSQLLQPVLGNQLARVDFRYNPTIYAVFDSAKVNPSGNSVDLPGLMKLIDEKCKKTVVKLFENFKSNLADGLSGLWNSGEFSDFIIIVGDRKFHVHKTVLALQSGFFKKLFSNQAENIAVLKNEDFNAEAVEEVLSYVYTGKIPDHKNATEIFLLAVKLKISALESIAEDLVIRSINQDNALEVLKFGHRFGSEKIKKEAFEVVKKFVKQPEMDEDLMEDPEELEKYVQAKKTCDEILKRCKKRKINE